MERTFTNREPDACCYICGEVIGTKESTWDRSPAKRGKAHIECMAAQRIAERNGGAPKAPQTSGTSAGSWLEGLAEQLVPHLENKLQTKLDGVEDLVRGAVKQVLDGAVMLKATTVTVKDVETGETKDMGLQHECFPRLMVMCKAVDKDGHHLNVWLHGPAATGKSTAARVVADTLDLPFYIHGSMTGAHEWLGFVDGAGKYHRTGFREAWEHGGVVLFDEVDGSTNEAVLPSMGPLANGWCTFPDSPKPMRKHVNCIIIGTGNSKGNGGNFEFNGRNKLDAAYLSRYTKIHWPIDEALELATSPNRDWCLKVQKWRKQMKAKGIKGETITPRATYYGAALLAAGATEAEAGAWAVQGTMSDADWSSIQC